GQSFGPEDLEPPKLPSWRWFKLRKQLQAGGFARGLARGETSTEAEAVYLVAPGRRPLRYGPKNPQKNHFPKHEFGRHVGLASKPRAGRSQGRSDYQGHAQGHAASLGLVHSLYDHRGALGLVYCFSYR